MSERLDDKDLVTTEELLMSQMIQLDAVPGLLRLGQDVIEGQQNFTPRTAKESANSPGN